MKSQMGIRFSKVKVEAKAKGSSHWFAFALAFAFQPRTFLIKNFNNNNLYIQKGKN